MDLMSVRRVLAMVESNADWNENGTVTLPLWVMDRVRSLQVRLAQEADEEMARVQQANGADIRQEP